MEKTEVIGGGYIPTVCKSGAKIAEKFVEDNAIPDQPPFTQALSMFTETLTLFDLGLRCTLFLGYDDCSEFSLGPSSIYETREESSVQTRLLHPLVYLLGVFYQLCAQQHLGNFETFI